VGDLVPHEVRRTFSLRCFIGGEARREIAPDFPTSDAADRYQVVDYTNAFLDELTLVEEAVLKEPVYEARVHDV
jgi:hypothetical protein